MTPEEYKLFHEAAKFNADNFALSPEQLAEIKARAAAATPGPWEVSSNTPRICSHVIGDGLDTSCLLHGNRWNDAAFIAHARADVPTLVAEVERLRAQNAEMLEALGKAQAYLDMQENYPNWLEVIQKAITSATAEEAG